MLSLSISKAGRLMSNTAVCRHTAEGGGVATEGGDQR